jgi:hypothetical protein
MEKNKKYLIKESELKEIIQEMILMELYDPKDYAGMYTKNYTGKIPNAGDALSGAWNMIKGIPNAIIPDEYKNQVANNGPGFWNDLQRRMLDMLGASAAGTAGPDWLPKLNQIGGKPGTGPNKNAEQQLNVNKAVDWLRNHAYPRYIKEKCGHCATYVRTALNAGGLDAPHGMDGLYAKNYIRILPENGWVEISPNQAGELCDVCVIDSCIGGNGKKHPAGHISMCIGNGVWASDFIQNSMVGISGGIKPGQGNVVHVFRYRNRV